MVKRKSQGSASNASGHDADEEEHASKAAKLAESRRRAKEWAEAKAKPAKASAPAAGGGAAAAAAAEDSGSESESEEESTAQDGGEKAAKLAESRQRAKEWAMRKKKEKAQSPAPTSAGAAAAAAAPSSAAVPAAVPATPPPQPAAPTGPSTGKRKLDKGEHGEDGPMQKQAATEDSRRSKLEESKRLAVEWAQSRGRDGEWMDISDGNDHANLSETELAAAGGGGAAGRGNGAVPAAARKHGSVGGGGGGNSAGAAGARGATATASSGRSGSSGDGGGSSNGTGYVGTVSGTGIVPESVGATHGSVLPSGTTASSAGGPGRRSSAGAAGGAERRSAGPPASSGRGVPVTCFGAASLIGIGGGGGTYGSDNWTVSPIRPALTRESAASPKPAAAAAAATGGSQPVAAAAAGRPLPRNKALSLALAAVCACSAVALLSAAAVLALREAKPFQDWMKHHPMSLPSLPVFPSLLSLHWLHPQPAAPAGARRSGEICLGNEAAEAEEEVGAAAAEAAAAVAAVSDAEEPAPPPQPPLPRPDCREWRPCPRFGTCVNGRLLQCETPFEISGDGMECVLSADAKAEYDFALTLLRNATVAHRCRNGWVPPAGPKLVGRGDVAAAYRLAHGTGPSWINEAVEVVNESRDLAVETAPDGRVFLRLSDEAFALQPLPAGCMARAASWAFLARNAGLLAALAVVLAALLAADAWRRRRYRRRCLEELFTHEAYRCLLTHAKAAPGQPYPVAHIQDYVLDNVADRAAAAAVSAGAGGVADGGGGGAAGGDGVFAGVAWLSRMRRRRKQRLLAEAWPAVEARVGEDSRVRLAHQTHRGQYNTPCWEWTAHGADPAHAPLAVLPRSPRLFFLHAN